MTTKVRGWHLAAEERIREANAKEALFRCGLEGCGMEPFVATVRIGREQMKKHRAEHHPDLKVKARKRGSYVYGKGR